MLAITIEPNLLCNQQRPLQSSERGGGGVGGTKTNNKPAPWLCCWASCTHANYLYKLTNNSKSVQVMLIQLTLDGKQALAWEHARLSYKTGFFTKHTHADLPIYISNFTTMCSRSELRTLHLLFQIDLHILLSWQCHPSVQCLSFLLFSNRLMYFYFKLLLCFQKLFLIK